MTFGEMRWKDDFSGVGLLHPSTARLLHATQNKGDTMTFAETELENMTKKLLAIHPVTKDEEAHIRSIIQDIHLAGAASGEKEGFQLGKEVGKEAGIAEAELQFAVRLHSQYKRTIGSGSVPAAAGVLDDYVPDHEHGNGPVNRR